MMHAASDHIKGLQTRVDLKTKNLRDELSNTNGKHQMLDLGPDGLTCPLEPSMKLYGVDPKQSRIFKSSVQPMQLMFKVRNFSMDADERENEPLPELEEYGIIFKNGDDLRQDQLVLLMIRIMDTLLKEINLDFKFTQYKCIAASTQIGFMEFVTPSIPVRAALAESGKNLATYLTRLSDAPDKRNEIFQNYLLSCAGYAVATYLLAVGDRHLENLMVQKKDGRMWHLDFGYILGKEPAGKGGFVSPIRINKAMVQGLGGMDSEGYREFVQKTIDAFLYLRNYRNTILNLFVLMIDSSLDNLPVAEYDAILTKLNKRFLPDLSNEQARKTFEMIIHESVNSTGDEFIELVNRFSVWLRY